MARQSQEVQLLPQEPVTGRRPSTDSVSSASTISLVFDRIGERLEAKKATKFSGQRLNSPYEDDSNGSRSHDEDDDKENDLESGPFLKSPGGDDNKTMDMNFRRLMWITGSVFMGAWVLALVVFLGSQSYRHASVIPHDPAATASRGNGRQITLEQVMSGKWRPQHESISWINGANGEDGLLLEKNVAGKDFLVVEDIRGRDPSAVGTHATQTLMKNGYFTFGTQNMYPSKVFPNKDLKKIMVATNVESNWRHSFYAQYWILDVATQSVEPLDPANKGSRVQLAIWSPNGDAIVFTRDNNLFLRKLSSTDVIQITTDGGSEYFYGVPDWVYEEEVFQTNTATWWADDGKYIAYLATNETQVPEYLLEYFISRPSGVKPVPGLENYPEESRIKYPKAGAPNPTVDLLFYDVERGDTFDVQVAGSFSPENLLITEVVWAGSSGKVLIRETNRDSDVLRVVLVDVKSRTGRSVRTTDIQALDGGWFEVSQDTRYIPADPSNGRPHDGYIDTVISDDFNHLGYFTPLDNPTPIMLTSGDWEVVKAPSAVDLKNNLVYFTSTKESSIQRHAYSVKIDGTDLQPLTDTTKEGYYDVSFSSGAGYVLVNYDGPGIPWQKVINTPSNPDHYEGILGRNEALANLAQKYELPIEIYSTVNVDGFDLNVVERRPPHFNEKKKYPVLFYLYNGPVSQQVNKQFTVDFQSYIAANLGYIVVTLDGRGTGYIGRKARTIIRGNIGYYEARDQIETAKMWAKNKYVDEHRMAIWGWSYGGFMTLKVLEQDAGETFQYGMAVAPVTDWRFYDSVYTERYMHTPQENPGGYDNTSISDMQALSQNVRFLIMHGVSDDNVHIQSTLTLIDKLDMAGVENYDVHFFPDSDHGIYFHNANQMVYDKLNNWLINAFNGEWLRTADPVPKNLDIIERKREIVLH
ncbi:putative dipeptidyl-aminopeptidase B [Calycina marina]|uniref:dipeptidyl-peptidase IV n=1 Tax=Calycina marina TaxID=1763456 RepID=A0A9P7Z4Y2_9HELO|nr:putative dipeptidyl-aminopeptidase B [Calycina marina]